MHILLAIPTYFLAIYAGLMLLFFAIQLLIPGAPPIIGFVARCMSAYLTLIVCAAYGTLASLVLRALNLHYVYGQWTTAKSFKWLGMATIGVKFDIIDNGLEILNGTKRPCVIVGNHQTELDILFLGWIWPKHTSVTAKKSLQQVPFLGWFMTLSGAIFINRLDRNAAFKSMESAGQAMKNKKQNVFMFPEGTRSYSAEPMLLPFKKGAFHLAVQAGCDVVPVVAENYSKILNVKRRIFRPGTIRVKVLDPIPTKDLKPTDVDDLTRETREKMLEALIQISTDSESKALKKHAS